MNRIRLLCILIFCLPGNAVAIAPTPRDLDDAITKSLKLWKVPGVAVVIVQDGKVVYLKGHGIREVGKDGAVTADTLFCLGSCSKAFTTASMAMLVDEKKLAWDDRVRDHLPTFRLFDALADREVRLRDLVCHRTGLPTNDLFWYRAPWSVEESVKRLGHLPLSKPFRTTFQYNSTTFTAAGLAAANAAKTTWTDLIQKRLLSPLGMKRACLDAAAADKDSDRAHGHRLDRSGKPESTPSVSMRKPDPAGSVHASVRDLVGWLRLHAEGGMVDGKRLVSVRALRETHTPQIPLRRTTLEETIFPDTTQSGYAMAWVVLDHKGHKLVAHGGAMDGHRAQIIIVPEKKLGIAVLSNLQQTSMNLSLGMTLLELMLDVPKKRDYDAIHTAVMKKRHADAEKVQRERLARRKPGTKPSRELIAYAGTYEHPAFGSVTIRLARGQLVWEYREEQAVLRHFHYDTFTVSSELPGQADVTFKLDEKGAIRQVEITGNFNVTFTRSDQ